MASVAHVSAADVTYERLRNPEPHNWLMNHRDFGSQRFSPLDIDQQVERQEPQARLRGPARRQGRQRICRGDAAGRRRLHVHHRRLGRGLQDRRALRHAGQGRLEDGPRPAEARPQPRRRALEQSGDLGHRLRRPHHRDRLPRPARSSGTRSTATSPISNSPRRRSRSRTRSSFRPPAATTACATGSPGSIPRPASSSGRPSSIPAPGEPGSETWKDKNNAWQTGGGALYVTGSYDPANNLTYWGTGNPAPRYDSSHRPGDNLFTNSTRRLRCRDRQDARGISSTPPTTTATTTSSGPQIIIDGKVNGEDRKLLDPRQPQRLPLRARSAERPVPQGRAVFAAR